MSLRRPGFWPRCPRLQSRDARVPSARDAATASRTAANHRCWISAAMLADLGCTYAEVGHSERRSAHPEIDAPIGRGSAPRSVEGVTPVSVSANESSGGSRPPPTP